jgi:hypothetical protein
MKYIITENRIKNIIFKFLDDKLDGVENKKGKHFDIIFAFPNEEEGILGWKSGQLYIFYELADEISHYFGIERVDSLKVIGDWVEDRYNLMVTKTRKWRKL